MAILLDMLTGKCDGQGIRPPRHLYLNRDLVAIVSGQGNEPAIGDSVCDGHRLECNRLLSDVTQPGNTSRHTRILYTCASCVVKDRDDEMLLMARRSGAAMHLSLIHI